MPLDGCAGFYRAKVFFSYRASAHLPFFKVFLDAPACVTAVRPEGLAIPPDFDHNKA